MSAPSHIPQHSGPTLSLPEPVVSLDIETYGAISTLPPQRHFHPIRSLTQDHIPLNELVINATITLSSPSLVPGETMTFSMASPAQRTWLAQWLLQAGTIVGMNLPFDLLYLRASALIFRHALHGRQLLLDLSHLNYLHSELRTERSLKALGPILGTHTYTRTIKQGRFPSPTDKEFLAYCAADTHNTLLACRELTTRIHADWPDTPKLSPYCLRHYSDTTWSVIRMSEAGIPFSVPALRTLRRTLESTITTATSDAASHGLQLEGTGSAASKDALIERCLTLAPDTLQHPLAAFTPKTRKFSFSDSNRCLLTAHLPPTATPELAALDAASRHQSAQKVLSTYVFPLLHHRRNDPTDTRSRLIPAPSGGIGLAYPTWYIIPSAAKEGASDDGGGTIQGRITCKYPSAQTFPPTVKECLASRWPNGTILSMDLSQVELRVAALCSGDTKLMAAFTSGLDLHTDRTLELFGPQVQDDPDFRSFWRQVGKTINFADLFLASAHRMRLSTYELTGRLLPLDLFRRIEESRPHSRPELWAWQQSLIRTADTHNHIVLPLTGQSRTFTGGSKHHLNEIVNFPIQTQASNTLLSIQNHLHTLLPPLDALILGPRILPFLQVYDALYLDVPEGQIKTAESLLKTAVTHVTSPTGYWGLLQSHHTRVVPLEYDLTHHPH